MKRNLVFISGGGVALFLFSLFCFVPCRGVARYLAADTVFNQVDAKGQRHGYWRRYYRNGQVAYRAKFSHGRPVGVTLRYAQNGLLELKQEYSAHDPHTVYVEYFDEKGQRIVRGKFYDKQKDSTWVYMAGNKKVREENWKRGRKHGVFATYSDQGHIAVKETWHNNQQHGPQEEYYGNGKLRMRLMMERDTPVGRTFTLFPNGMTRLVGQYKNGVRDSVWVLYNSFGKEEQRVEYKEGVPVGQDSLVEVQTRLLESFFRNAGRIPEPTDAFRERYP